MGQKIDVIIPAHRAHQTLPRTLESIAAQNILPEISVTVVDDACPEGNYDNIILPFKSRMNLKLIRRSQNGGAGAARQTGIDATTNPYFTCIDADDIFLNAGSLATLRRGIETSDSVKCCAGKFISQKRDNVEKCVKNMASMDGKLYRRDFIDSYGIRFNGTRSNEDMGYNMLVILLCDNPAEQTLWLDDTVCYVHYRPDSVTGAGGGQFIWDQLFCGFVDNFIWAVDEAKPYRPFSTTITQFLPATPIGAQFRRKSPFSPRRVGSMSKNFIINATENFTAPPMPKRKKIFRLTRATKSSRALRNNRVSNCPTSSCRRLVFKNFLRGFGMKLTTLNISEQFGAT